MRPKEKFLHLAPYKEAFEALLNQKLCNWNDNLANGRFQCCLASDAIPYHSDTQSAAGVLFLTPPRLRKGQVYLFLEAAPVASAVALRSLI